MTYEELVREAMSIGFEDGIPVNLVQLSDRVGNTAFMSTLNDHDKQLNRALDYFRTHYADLGPKDQAMLRIIAVVYHTGMFGVRQLEHGLYLSEAAVFEFQYALTLRAYVEIVGRSHKAIRLVKGYQSTRNEPQLELGAQRIVTRFTPPDFDGTLRSIYQEFAKNDNREALISQVSDLVERSKNASEPRSGYNVMILVQSLRDKIPHIDKDYDRLSGYLHGDFTEHYAVARTKMLVGPVAGYPFIKSQKPLHEQLKAVVVEDLEYLHPFAQEYIDRL